MQLNISIWLLLDVMPHTCIDVQHILADEPDQIREIRSRGFISDVSQHRLVVNYRIENVANQMNL